MPAHQPPDDPIEVAAANLMGWHDCSIRALGFPTGRGAWWWTSPTPGPWIYFTAIALRRPRSAIDRAASRAELRRHLDDPAGSFEAVCDSFDSLDLGRQGLRRRARGRWFTRAAGPVTDESAAAGVEAGRPALEISDVRTVDDLAAFERVTCRSFGAPEPVTPFEIHGRAILDDPAMRVVLGRVEGEVVTGAMAYDDGTSVGIYGVGTTPGHRGHGHATAVTRACLAGAPDRPAVLQPSAEAERLYLRLGFTEAGRFAHWG